MHMSHWQKICLNLNQISIILKSSNFPHLGLAILMAVAAFTACAESDDETERHSCSPNVRAFQICEDVSTHPNWISTSGGSSS